MPDSSFPAGERRKAHEDRVDVAARLEAEQGAAVVQQVELDIAAAEGEQPVHIRLIEGRLHALAHDRRENLQERLADIAGEGEIRLERGALARFETFKMVVEDAAD